MRYDEFLSHTHVSIYRRAIKMLDVCELPILYHARSGKYSCQPFVLQLPPGKSIKLDMLLSEIKGILRIESATMGNHTILDEFRDEEGEFLKKMEIVDTHIFDQNSALILTTHETEKSVYFRGQNYLFLKTNFILTKVEFIKDTYYLYVFAKESSIKEYVEVLGEKFATLGLNIGDFSLSKTALSELHEELGGELKEFSLNNVTSRLKSIQGKGNDLQNDDMFKELKDKPNAEVYRYLLRINEPHADLNLENLTVSIRSNCFIHSYHHITYDALLSFVRENIIPKAVAKVFVHHPLSAYTKLEIYEDYPETE